MRTSKFKLPALVGRVQFNNDTPEEQLDFVESMIQSFQDESDKDQYCSIDMDNPPCVYFAAPLHILALALEPIVWQSEGEFCVYLSHPDGDLEVAKTPNFYDED